MQAELRSDVEHLTAIERPSASPGERRAAEWIAERLRAAGLDPRVETERATGGVWWPVGLLNAVALAAAELPWHRARPALPGRGRSAARAARLAPPAPGPRGPRLPRARRRHRPSPPVLSPAAAAPPDLQR